MLALMLRLTSQLADEILEKIMTERDDGARSLRVVLPPKYRARKPLSSVPGKFVAGILAAGVAKRLEPISSIIAKPMFPLGGDFPICQNWVERLERVGIGQIGMNLYAVPVSIKEHFGDGSAFLTEISYVHEEAAPSGTLGGAIRIMDMLERKLGPSFDTIVVPSGDVITEMTDDDFMAMLTLHKQNRAAATLLLTPVPWNTLGEFGTVEPRGYRGVAGKDGRQRLLCPDPNLQREGSQCFEQFGERLLLRFREDPSWNR